MTMIIIGHGIDRDFQHEKLLAERGIRTMSEQW